MNNYEKKAGHPVLGVILGVLGVLIALLLTFVTGAIGGAVALLLGLFAVLIGLSARKKGGRGIGAIITGALAILLAVVMTLSSINSLKLIQKQVAQYADEAPLVVKTLEQPYFGMLGLIMNLPKDEGSAQELIDQFNLVSEKIKAANGETAAPAVTPTEAPES